MNPFARLCFIDIETTGLDPAVEQVLEVGLVFVEDGTITARRRWSISAGREVSVFITALTGLDGTEGTASSLEAIGAELSSAIAGWTLVAHNANFERSFLGPLLSQSPMLDSYFIATLLFPELEGHSLDALVRWLGVGRAARHRALDDCEDTFAMLEALAARLTADDVARAHAACRHLDASSADQRALIEYLSALSAGTKAPAPAEASPPWPALFPERARGPLTLEIERERLLPSLWNWARARKTATAIAVPRRRLRAEATRYPALAWRPVCRGALLDALGRLPLSEGRAWLSSWLATTRAGDLRTISTATLERHAALREQLELAARGCTCSRADCFFRHAPPADGPWLIGHEHLLELMERAEGPAAAVVLDADRLPDAERGRLEARLHVGDLEDFGLDCQALREALAAFQPGPVVTRARTGAPWSRIREEAGRLAAQLQRSPVSGERARLLTALTSAMEPPGPGSETVVGLDFIARGPARPHVQVMRRLRRGHVLVSGFVGGLRWTRQSAWVIPAERIGGRVEFSPQPVDLSALIALLQRESEVTLVTSEALEPLAEACARAGLPTSLDEARPARVLLRRWRRDEPKPSDRPCVLYGVREWRRAILGADAPRTVLASPRGIDEAALRAACRGIELSALTSTTALPTTPGAS